MPRIIDVIEWTDDTGKAMVNRIPARGSGDFRFGSNIIVRESQVAVFFRDGKTMDIFDPGKHVISTANIPILIDLIKLGTRGKTPFTAEVYFVSMRQFLDLGWGTPEPITMRDADLGMVRLRAFGTYAMEVSDPSLFVNKIVGTRGIYETSQIENHLRGIIISKMTDLLGELGKPLLDLPAMYDEIGAATKAKVSDDFAAVGIRLNTLYVRSISPTEETAKAIDERAQMGAIGDMNKYLQFQAARGIRDAAQNPSGGAASTGLGLGAGLGLGQMMAGAMTGAQQAPAAAVVVSVPDVMTIAEAAAYMKVGEDDITAMIDSGDIKAKKIGKSYRLARKALDDFLSS